MRRAAGLLLGLLELQVRGWRLMSEEEGAASVLKLGGSGASAARGRSPLPAYKCTWPLAAARLHASTGPSCSLSRPLVS